MSLIGPPPGGNAQINWKTVADQAAAQKKDLKPTKPLPKPPTREQTTASPKLERRVVKQAPSKTPPSRPPPQPPVSNTPKQSFRPLPEKPSVPSGKAPPSRPPPAPPSSSAMKQTPGPEKPSKISSRYITEKLQDEDTQEAFVRALPLHLCKFIKSRNIRSLTDNALVAITKSQADRMKPGAQDIYYNELHKRNFIFYDTRGNPSMTKFKEMPYIFQNGCVQHLEASKFTPEIIRALDDNQLSLITGKKWMKLPPLALEAYKERTGMSEQLHQ